MNPYHTISCDVCGTRASASGLANLETDDDDELDSSVGSVFMPLLRPCNNKGKNSSSRVPLRVDDDIKESIRARCVNAATKRKNREDTVGVEEDEIDSVGYRGVKTGTKAVDISGIFNFFLFNSGFLSMELTCFYKYFNMN